MKKILGILSILVVGNLGFSEDIISVFNNPWKKGDYTSMEKLWIKILVIVILQTIIIIIGETWK